MSGKSAIAAAARISGERPVIKKTTVRPKSMSKNIFKKSGKDLDHCPVRMVLMVYSVCGKRSKK